MVDAKQQTSTLWRALLKFEDDVVKLIKEGADPDEKLDDPNEFYSGLTFVQYAVYLSSDYDHKTKANPCHRVAQVLLENGANVNAIVPERFQVVNAIQSAIYCTNLNYTKFLLKNGADLQALDRKGNSLLQQVFLNCSHYDLRQFVRLLLDNKVDKNFINLDGENVFHSFVRMTRACQEDEKEIDIAKMLLENSETLINGQNKHGETPLHRAIVRDKHDLSTLFIQKGAIVNTRVKVYDVSPFYTAIATGFKVKFIRLMLQQGATVNDNNAHGSTPLHAACGVNNIKIIRELLLRGADIGAETLTGATPFSIAHHRSFQDCKQQMMRWICRAEITYLSSQSVIIKISNNDLNLIKNNSENNQYYEKCREELMLMKTTKLHDLYSFFNILMMCDKLCKQFCNLSVKPEFVRSFSKNLKLFPMYRSVLKKIYIRAFVEKKKKPKF